MTMLRSPILILAALLASRFLFLGERVYHHDESMYAVYALKVTRSLEYIFDPMLHGPLLYFFQGLCFKLFGDTDATGRLASAISGVLLVAGGLAFFRKEAHKAWAFALLITVSPLFAFYSRFLGMDMLMCALAMWGLVGVRLMVEGSAPRMGLVLFAVCASLLTCVKLNFLFYAGVLLSFPVALYILDAQHRGAYRDQLLDLMRRHALALSLCVLLGVLVFAFFYSGAFRHPEGILNGLYRKMLPYWVEQHKIQRIKGAFFYHVPILATYEAPLILLTLGMLVATVKLHLRYVLGVLGVSIIVALADRALPHALEAIRHGLHMHARIDLAVTVGILLMVGRLIHTHIHRRDLWPAFFLYAFLCSFFLYAYAGEKVPWLSTHIALPAYLYICSLISARLRNSGLQWGLFLLIAWQAYNVTRASFINVADPKERLVYTHTSQELKAVLANIDVLGLETGMGKILPLAVPTSSSVVWPLAWYLRDHGPWLVSKIDPQNQPALVMHDVHLTHELPEEITRSYIPQRLPFRVWWVPPATCTLAQCLNYYVRREPFGQTGSLGMQVWVRPDLQTLWSRTKSDRP